MMGWLTALLKELKINLTSAECKSKNSGVKLPKFWFHTFQLLVKLRLSFMLEIAKTLIHWHSSGHSQV